MIAGVSLNLRVVTAYIETVRDLTFLSIPVAIPLFANGTVFRSTSRAFKNPALQVLLKELDSSHSGSERISRSPKR